MKNLAICLLSIFSCLLIGAPSLPTAAAGGPNAWVETVIKGSDNTTKLHFYVHDIRAGANATLYGVASASITSTSPTGFGQVNVFDDRITAEPDINSEEVARAQGTIASTGLQVRAVAINMNFFITSGEFNGSTITIVGRNPILDSSRELPIVGGTGAFRLARGYAVTTTYLNDAAANYSILEYTVYLIYSSVVWTGI